MGRESSGSDVDDVCWQDYEELVKDIHEVLGRDSGIAIECWGSKCRVEGLLGEFHQIDVLTRHTDGLYEYKTAIECKYWDEKVGRDVVMKLAQIIQDAKLNKGVVVSKMGFTDPAKVYAQSHHIDLVELRKPMDKDWEGYIREVRFSLTVDLPPNFDVRLQVAIPKERPDREAIRKALGNVSVRAERFFVDVPGQESKPFRELIVAEVRAQPNEETYVLHFPVGSVLTNPDNPEHPLCGCVITGASVEMKQRQPLVEEVVIRMDNHIYMIMESVFDGRRFTITKDGEIRENSQWLDETAVESR